MSSQRSSPESAPAATPLPGELHVSLRNVPVARFESLWPQTLSPGGRQWVLANVGEGLLEEAAFRLGIAVVPGARSAEITSAAGSLRYRDLAIRYLDGLPPVRSVDGTAKFTGKTLVFSPHDGEVAGVRLTGGTVQITDLGEPVEWIAIDLGLAGPLRGVLQTLDSGRLHYANAIGIDPASVTGRAEGNLHFKLPLLRDVRFDQIGYGAKGALHHVAISDIAMGLGISDGEFALEIKQAGASLQGRAEFDAVPTDIDAKLIFKPKTGPRVRCHVNLTVDDAQRRRLAGGYLRRPRCRTRRRRCGLSRFWGRPRRGSHPPRSAQRGAGGGRGGLAKSAGGSSDCGLCGRPQRRSGHQAAPV